MAIEAVHSTNIRYELKLTKEKLFQSPNIPSELLNTQSMQTFPIYSSLKLFFLILNF